MSSTFFKSAAFIAAIAPLVAGHGYVIGTSIGDRWYTGFQESTWENKADGSPILITSYLEPNYNVYSNDITCGRNPKAAQYHAPINAGQSVGWKWNTHDSMPWTHTMGTHRSFIGSCHGDCGSVNLQNIEWIELSSEYTGQQNYDSGSGNWPVQVLHDGGMWWDKIPNLPAGKYIIRNELTALHYSWKTVGSRDDGHDWGTEFYPTCMALEIQGTDGSFSVGHTWKFPGSYYENQPGHYNPDVHTNPGGTVMAALSGGQGYSNDYSSGSTNNNNNNSGNTSNNNSNNNSGNNGGSSPAANAPAATTTTTASSGPTAGPQVCKRGSRRARAEAKAKKMRRAHKALRRSEH